MEHKEGKAVLFTPEGRVEEMELGPWELPGRVAQMTGVLFRKTQEGHQKSGAKKAPGTNDWLPASVHISSALTQG